MYFQKKKYISIFSPQIVPSEQNNFKKLEFKNKDEKIVPTYDFAYSMMSTNNFQNINLVCECNQSGFYICRSQELSTFFLQESSRFDPPLALIQNLLSRIFSLLSPHISIVLNKLFNSFPILYQSRMGNIHTVGPNEALIVSGTYILNLVVNSIIQLNRYVIYSCRSAANNNLQFLGILFKKVALYIYRK